MEWKIKVTENGNSLYVRVPSELGKYLEIEKGTDIIMRDDSGKHGVFVSFWNPQQQLKIKKNDHISGDI